MASHAINQTTPPAMRPAVTEHAPHPADFNRGDHVGLYANVAKIHPRKVSGPNRRWKSAVMGILLAILLCGPWIRWDRGPGAPDQAILFDFVAMRGYFLDAAIWPQEFYFVTGLLVIATIALFLATALLGRIWCGYACPQTVWTDIFVWIECMVEGDRNARMRLDKAPMSLSKAAKKAITHLAWLTVSLLTGASFVFYFTDAPTALRDLTSGEGGVVLYGFVAFFTLSTYIMAGWAREQVCFYMCPWPRIQGPMVDQHSVIVSYDAARGENRAAAKPGQSFDQRGHCVDCRMCVQVCPTGIDIRDGMQMECIGCGLCADACDSVMERFGLPKNLVGWRALSQTTQSPKPPILRWYRRPRVIAYVVLLIASVLGMKIALDHRQMLDLSILHDRSPFSVTLSDGAIRNDYTVKVINRERSARSLNFAISGMEGGQISVLGQDSSVLTAAADSVTTYRISIRVAAHGLRPGSAPVEFRLTDISSGSEASRPAVFVVESGQ